MGTRVPARTLIIGNPGKIRREVSAGELALFLQGTRGYVEFRELFRDKDKRQDISLAYK
jgi:carbonic anhydrase/acetyltransferase-like protein (isoleucine patch superfamily)